MKQQKTVSCRKIRENILALPVMQDGKKFNIYLVEASFLDSIGIPLVESSDKRAKLLNFPK